MKAVRCIFTILAVQAAYADAWSGYGMPLQARSSPHWSLFGRRWLARTLHRATGIRWANLARRIERRHSIGLFTEKAIANAVVKYLHPPAVKAFRRQADAAAVRRRQQERPLWPEEKNECMPRRYARRLRCPVTKSGYLKVGDSCYFFSRGLGNPPTGVDLASARRLCSLVNDPSGQSLGHWSLLAINSERESLFVRAFAPMITASYWIDQLHYVDSMRVYDATDSVFRHSSDCSGLSKARPRQLRGQPRRIVQRAIENGRQPPACSQMSKTPRRRIGTTCSDRPAGFICELALDGNAANFNEFY